MAEIAKEASNRVIVPIINSCQAGAHVRFGEDQAREGRQEPAVVANEEGEWRR